MLCVAALHFAGRRGASSLWVTRHPASHQGHSERFTGPQDGTEIEETQDPRDHILNLDTQRDVK